MVDEVNFPKGLPPVPASGRVQRVNRKKGDEEKSPFKEFLNEEDEKDKKKKKRKKESDKVDIQRKAEQNRTQNPIESSSSVEAADAGDESDKKIIDVRV